MKSVLAFVLLGFGLCWASSGQGIDEENVESSAFQTPADPQNMIEAMNGVTDYFLERLKQDTNSPIVELENGLKLGEYSATGVSFKNPYLAKRIGSVSAKENGFFVDLKVTLSLEEAELNMKAFKIGDLTGKDGKIYPKGAIKVRVAVTQGDFHQEPQVNIESINYDKLVFTSENVKVTGVDVNDIYKHFFEQAVKKVFQKQLQELSKH